MSKFRYILCLGILSFFYGCDNSFTVKNSNALTFEKSSRISLKEIAQGRSKTAKFYVRNIGNFPITIDKLVTSCGCTAASIDFGVIGPGKGATLQAEMSNYGRMGLFMAQIDVFWSAKDNSIQGKITAIVDAIAEQAATSSTNAINFDTVEVNSKPISKEFEIRRGNSAENWNQIKITSKSKNITARCITEPDQSPVRIEVQLNTNGLHIGHFKDRIEFELLNKRNASVKKISLLVEASLNGNLKAVPSSLYFGILPVGKSMKRVIELKSINGQEFSFEGVDCSEVKGKISLIEQLKNRNSVFLTFEYSAPNELGNFSSNLYISVLDNGKKESLEIPIIGFVKK